MARKRDPEVRKKIWTYLNGSPGHTSHEVARAGLGLRAPTSSTTAGVFTTLTAMERAGLVTRTCEFRAHVGREVSVWFAVPGKF
jgi:hypothetical protein